jgi:hypothetical protein
MNSLTERVPPSGVLEQVADRRAVRIAARQRREVLVAQLARSSARDGGEDDIRRVKPLESGSLRADPMWNIAETPRRGRAGYCNPNSTASHRCGKILAVTVIASVIGCSARRSARSRAGRTSRRSARASALGHASCGPSNCR